MKQDASSERVNIVTVYTGPNSQGPRTRMRASDSRLWTERPLTCMRREITRSCRVSVQRVETESMLLICKHSDGECMGLDSDADGGCDWERLLDASRMLSCNGIGNGINSAGGVARMSDSIGTGSFSGSSTDNRVAEICAAGIVALRIALPTIHLLAAMR